MWTGFCTVALTTDPSPKFQDHDVGVFVELSVYVTVNGGVPDVGVPVKLATGVGTVVGVGGWCWGWCTSAGSDSFVDGTVNIR